MEEQIVSDMELNRMLGELGEVMATGDNLAARMTLLAFLEEAYEMGDMGGDY